MGNERNGERNFVDSNIFLYVVQAHPQFGKVSRAILRRIDKGEKAVTSLVNLAEICWWLEKHGKKDQIEDELKLVTSILNLEIASLTPEDFLLAGKLVKEHGIDFNDCIILSVMRRLEIKRIYSNDPDFDRVEWVNREFE
jgi:predicted nucleic acid-binding protein